MAEVGIDLGTTNSAVAHLRNTPEIIENQGRSTTPSVVAWEADEGILVGQAAKDQALFMPVVREVKREMGKDERIPLGSETYLPEEISALILKDLKKAAEERLGEPVESAVITIPAYFTMAMNEATKKAGELAGFKSVRLLAEPEAAALAYGAEDLILVYDLGGGTFDVAVIDCFDFKMRGLAGNNHLGGADFDALLFRHLSKAIKEKCGVDIESDKLAVTKAKEECETVKIKLSSKKKWQLTFNGTVNDRPVNIALDVTRDDFEAMIMEHVDGTIATVEEAIAKAHEKDESITKDAITTVLLVGGSTYAPLVQRKLTEYFGFEPSKRVNPDLAVALGAAVYSGTGPAVEGIHRITLRPVPLVTKDSTLAIKGRTSPGAKLAVEGAVAPVNGVADSAGKFELEIQLKQDASSDIVVAATDDAGEERRAGFAIRHGSDFDGTEEKPRRPGAMKPLTPRALGVRVTGQDDLLDILIPAQSEIPIEVTRDYQMSGGGGIRTRMPVYVHEGDLAFAPLNTNLGTATLECAALPEGTPIAVTFRITEDGTLFVKVIVKEDPSKKVDATIKIMSPTGKDLHVIERSDNVLLEYGGKLAPEEKAAIRKSKQALLDVCEQYRNDPNSDRYSKVKQLGLELRSMLDKIDSSSSASAAPASGIPSAL